MVIVTTDVVGLIKNGGIGTANFHLAKEHVRQGHQVTLLYCCHETQKPSHGDLASAVSLYEELGVELVCLIQEATPCPDFIGGDWKDYPIQPGIEDLRLSFLAYRWLDEHPSDVIIFQDWRGLGFYATQAKKTGTSFDRTLLCVHCHSPELWVLVNNHSIFGPTPQAEIAYQMEKSAVRDADIVFSPSQYLLNWMRNYGFELDPQRTMVLPYAIDFPDPVGSRDREMVDELVFFGRLETRKGIKLFFSALDYLCSRHAASLEALDRPLKVTLLGKYGLVDGRHVIEYLATRRELPVELKIITHLDSERAIEYLSQPGRVAFMCSRADNSPLTVLEALHNGIPFQATTLGGMPEMVTAEDIPKVLFEPVPQQLALRILQLLKDGARTARPAYSIESIRQCWQSMTRTMQDRLEAMEPRTDQPRSRVTVCMINHNRPHFLRQTFAGLAAQTYQNFDVVLVDDGSDEPATLAYLAELEAGIFKERDWKLVRATNEYVGRARNLAAFHATNDWLVFMDNDNYARPNQLEALVRAVELSDADAVTCIAIAFESAPDCDRIPSTPGHQVRNLYIPMGNSPSAGLYDNTYGDANCIVRRSAFQSIGGFTEQFGVSFEDWEFFSRLDHGGFRIRILPEPLMWLRSVQGSVTKVTNELENWMRILQPAIERGQDLDCSDALLVHLIRNHLDTFGLNEENSLARQANFDAKLTQQIQSNPANSPKHNFCLVLALQRLSKPALRNAVIDEIHRECPEGIQFLQYCEDNLPGKEYIEELLGSEAIEHHLNAPANSSLDQACLANLLLRFRGKAAQEQASNLIAAIDSHDPDLPLEFRCMPVLAALATSPDQASFGKLASLAGEWSDSYARSNPDLMLPRDGRSGMEHYLKRHERGRHRLPPLHKVYLKSLLPDKGDLAAAIQSLHQSEPSRDGPTLALARIFTLAANRRWPELFCLAHNLSLDFHNQPVSENWDFSPAEEDGTSPEETRTPGRRWIRRLTRKNR